MPSKFITNAEVMETVNNSDSDAYETEHPNESEKTDEEISLWKRQTTQLFSKKLFWTLWHLWTEI
jgi:hypothetical protein